MIHLALKLNSPTGFLLWGIGGIIITCVMVGAMFYAEKKKRQEKERTPTIEEQIDSSFGEADIRRTKVGAERTYKNT